MHKADADGSSDIYAREFNDWSDAMFDLKRPASFDLVAGYLIVSYNMFVQVECRLTMNQGKIVDSRRCDNSHIIIKKPVMPHPTEAQIADRLDKVFLPVRTERQGCMPRTKRSFPGKICSCISARDSTFHHVYLLC